MSTFAAELRDLVTKFAGDRADQEAGPQARRETWAELIDLGLRDVALPEEHGGPGGTLADLVAVVATLAESRLATPIVEESVGRWACALSGVELPEPVTVGTSVQPVGGASTLVLPWGRDCEAAVVCADGEARLLRLADIPLTHDEDLADLPSDVVPWSDIDWASCVPLQVTQAQVRARRALLRSAALLGATRGAYALTRDYVAGREQFGAPLLRLAPVASNLAVMRVHLVEAEAALQRALDGGEPSPGQQVPSEILVCAVTVAAASTEVAAIAHQLHGAIGTTGEYPLARLTRAIWAWRDADQPVAEYERELGERAIAAGPDEFWDSLTAWDTVLG